MRLVKQSLMILMKVRMSYLIKYHEYRYLGGYFNVAVKKGRILVTISFNKRGLEATILPETE